jgi:hypothetical protein
MSKDWIDLRENPEAIFFIQIVDRDGDIVKINGGLRLERDLIKDISERIRKSALSHNEVFDYKLPLWRSKKNLKKYCDSLHQELIKKYVSAVELAVCDTIVELKKLTIKQIQRD